MSRLHPISGCEDAGRLADVVFIHGLGGDPFATWCHEKDESCSWPHWLGEEFPQVGIWSLGYAASPTRWARFLPLIGIGSRDSGHSMALHDRALQVLDIMIQKHLGTRPLMFICHSLGGLLAKQILRKSSDAVDLVKQRVASQTRAILFLATPHSGAIPASLANAFRAVFGATVSLEDLREHDAHLRDLYDWYRNHAPYLSVKTITYFELRNAKGVLPIVNPTSAHPGVGDDPIGLDEDHLSIAKPRGRDSQVCGAACNLLRNHVLTALPVFSSAMPDARLVAFLPHTLPTPKALKLERTTIAGGEAHRVPRELPPAAFKFFGRKAERKQLDERLRAGLSTAVVGPAGMGKTALAADVLADVVDGNGVNLAAGPFPDGIVYLDLYELHGQAEPAWNTLANRICGAEFMDRWPARERATEACRARRLLVILEGGEEADGSEGRATIPKFLSVLSPENRWLLLSRVSTQAAAAETVDIREALHPEDAAALLDSLTERCPLGSHVRQIVLKLLAGHPLALNWAGNLLARDGEDPAELAGDWETGGLPKLSDPKQAERTLLWLFNRSVQRMSETARQALAAAGLLARAPIPLGLVVAGLGAVDADYVDEKSVRDALKCLVQHGLLRRAENEHWEIAHVLGYRFARDEDCSDPELRQHLGRWLHAHLLEALEINGKKETSNSLGALVQHAAALLRADADGSLWEPLVRGLLYRISDRMEDIGRLDLVICALDGVDAWLARFPETKAEEPYWCRQRCVLIVDKGDVLSAQGDLAGALAAYRESLSVIQRLAKSDPSNVDWQRDTGVSQERIGDVLSAQGDLAGSLAAYRKSLLVRRRLIESDPSNEAWKRDLSASHNKVGDVLRDQGDLAGSLAAYKESLSVIQRLFESDPLNAGLHRDLSVSQDRIGDVLRAQGDLAGSLAAYKESLSVIQRLFESDPPNAVWQRNLSVSHNKVGDVLRDQGDLAGALAACRESLSAIQRLSESDPLNAGWQRDLSVSLNRVGDVLRVQGDLSGALGAYKESLSVIQRLSESDPTNAVWQRDLSVSHNKMGDVLRVQGDLPGALDTYRESLSVRRRLAESDPTNAGWQRDLSFSLTRLAEFYELQGDCTTGLPLAEESLSIDERLAALDGTNVVWQNDVVESRALVARLRTGSR